MAKMSFEEWKLYREYEKYLADSKEEPEEKPEQEVKPEKEEKPEQETKPEQENDYGKEIAEIRKQLALMSKALSPSLNDVEPVGIDDVVKKFFSE